MNSANALRIVFSISAAWVFVGAAVCVQLRADPPAAGESPFILDEFSANVVDERWRPREGVRVVGYNIGAALVPDAVGGKMQIVGRLAEDRSLTRGLPFTCGGLVSRFEVGYGFYEMTARLPVETGWHCSFWIGGPNEIDGPEMDAGPGIVEADFSSHYWPKISDDPSNPSSWRVRHLGWALDYEAGGVPGKGRVRKIPIDAAGAYHRYAFEWTPSHLYFYIDGVRVAESRYPGPHHAPNDPDWRSRNKLYITNLAFKSPVVRMVKNVPQPVVMYVDDFKYYRRIYGFENWRSASLNVALPAGDGSFDYSRNALDPDQLYTTASNPGVISSSAPGAEVRWKFPATTISRSGRYEVFVWNPSTFPAGYISADISAQPLDAQGNPSGMPVVYAINGTHLPPIDQVYAGQSWIGLGAKTLSGPADVLTLSAPASSTKPLWPLRAGPAIFRPLEYFDDFAAGMLESAWTPVMGGWDAAGAYASNATKAESILLRQGADVAVGDGIVRAKVGLPSTGGASSVGLIARHSPFGHYLLRVDYETGKIGLLKYLQGSYHVIADTLPPPDMKLTGDMELVFALRNSGPDVNLLGFVSGRPVVAATDYAAGATFLGTGQAGLRAAGGTAHFDDFGIGK